MEKDRQPRKLKFIGCEIIYREACRLAATGPNQVDVEFLHKGLHDLETRDMLAKVQAAVDAVDPKAGYEAILLGYARCNDGLVGLTARDIPLVVPRAHDCITFFFGSRAAYRDYFDGFPGTYYKTSGWCERNRPDDGDYTRPAYGRQGVMANFGLAQSHEDLIAKYGRDNAEYIQQVLGAWVNNYSRCLYLEMGVCDERAFIEQSRLEAQDRNWDFELRKGDWTLLKKLFEGDWDEDFVVVQPGRKLVARNDEAVLDAAL